MSKLSFSDKLRIFFDVASNSGLYIIILFLLIIVGIVYFTTNKRNSKRNKIIYSATTILIVVSLILAYHGSLNKMFQYMMDNLFIVIYFPNLAIYLAALIITNIILWISVFNYKTSKSIKTLNITVYIILNYLLALILNIINEKKLDIFTQSSIYGNQKVTALIELSSTLFIVWIIFLVVYKIILIYLRKDYKPKVKKILIKKKVKKLPENFVPLENPIYVYGNAPKRPVIVKEQPQIIKSEEYEELKQLDSLLTLEDYKKVLKLLKDQNEKKQQEEAIKKEIKEEQIKYDELIKKQRNTEQQKYEELLNLYR